MLIHQQKTYNHQFCVDPGCCLDDLSIAMINKDGGQASKESVPPARDDDDDDDGGGVGGGGY